MSTAVAVLPAKLKRIYREEFDIRKLGLPKVELREEIDPDELEGLGQSIADIGMLHPLIVTTRSDGYELIAGGRRFRSAQKNQQWMQPAYVYENLSDELTLIISVIENIHRIDLEPMWEAYAYRVMIDRDKKTVEQIARIMRKPEARIRSRLKLLGLDPEVQRMVQRRELPASTATVIAEIPEKSVQKAMAQKTKDSALPYDVVKRMVDDAEKEERRKKREKAERERAERAAAERRRFQPAPTPRPAPSASLPKAASQSATSKPQAPSPPTAPKPPARPHVLPVAKQDAEFQRIALKCEDFTQFLDRIKLSQFDVKHLNDLNLLIYRLTQGLGIFSRKIAAEPK